MIPTIETLRLKLRPLTEDDAHPLHMILVQPDMLRYFPNTNPPKRDQVERLITNQLAHWKTYGYGWWAVEWPADRQFIGWCGLQYLPETEETEVAYLLSRPFWGQGLATEAAKASLHFGFDGLKIDTIVGIVHPKNLASRRVIEKSGLKFVERSRYFGMDCFRYVLDRQSYLARSSGENT